MLPFPSTLHPRTAAIITLLLSLLLLCCAPTRLATQAPATDGEVLFYDNTYADHIRTVRLHVEGFPNSYPLIQLGGGARLRLSFDDFSDDVRRYAYRFVHCNRDWQPSNLGAMEYNSGFASDFLENYDFSLRTLAQYTHYDLTFPNRNMRLDVSGNYLLVVYDTQDDDRPIITRRFMVTENVAGVGAQVRRATVAGKIRTHQEVQLTVNTKQLRPRAPLQEISATILQNGRWDNAITDIAPNLLGNESVQFNQPGSIIFRGGNEFRNLDVRSVQAPRTEVVSITNEGTHIAMMLAPERTRGSSSYLRYFDLNGDFVNFRYDRPVIDLADEFLQENFRRFELDFTGEYIQLTFVLKTPDGNPLDEEVYLFGRMTDWQMDPAFRMVWNPNISAYVGRHLLKQGFYNYYYVTQQGSRAVYDYTEDNFDQTENDYIGLVYYRPLGGRYDRLVGSTTVNTVQ